VAARRSLRPVRAAAFLLWAALIIAPAVITFAPTQGWSGTPASATLACLCTIAIAWAAGGWRWFFLLTYPLALFGAYALGADLVSRVDLLELLLLSGASTPWHETTAVLSSHALGIGSVAVALLALALWPAIERNAPTPRAGDRRTLRWAVPALLAVTAAAAAVTPGSFLAAWPVNIIALAYAKVSGNGSWIDKALPFSVANPRDPAATWQASRTAGAQPDGRETYVLVIGESVRADRLGHCGNARDVKVSVPQALVFCDVLAGASNTSISVPLLISRNRPGGLLRVSRDATFMKAFEEAGFSTHWLSVQEPYIAWPDAQHVSYWKPDRPDAEVLLPPLERLLAASPNARNLIVLHTYDAHFPYCNRFDAAQAPIHVDCRGFALPGSMSRAKLVDSYDNAVAESMRFFDRLAAILSRQEGDAFLLYTSDHGENLLDDGRGLLLHALSFPTRWDTRVPAIAWANAQWRSRHPAQWEQLRSNQRERLVHADLVPTLLGAAGISYLEARPWVTDLTRAKPGPRVRWVQRGLGSVVDGDQL
jgi:glucan phosphoethanolaminetransferase (alkaline phosphatase superfamily)